MRPMLKNNKQPKLGKYLEDTKEAFLNHLQFLGLFERVNSVATTTSPIVTYPVSKLLIHNLSEVSDPTNDKIMDRIDILWDLFDIIARINRSTEAELRDLRAKIVRLELFHSFLIKEYQEKFR